MILTSWIQFMLFVVSIVSVLILSVPSNLQMGSDYFDSFEYDKAFEYFSKAQKKDEMNLGNLKRLKEYFLVKGETEKAMLLQEKLVLLRPQNVHYIQDMEKLYDWNLMPYEKLQAEEKEAALVNPTEAKRLYKEIAEGYRWLKKYKDANRIYLKLLQYNDPEISEMAVGYFTSTMQSGNSLQLLQDVSNKTKKPLYLRWLAEVEESEGRFLKANEYYQKILSNALGKNFNLDQIPQYNKRVLTDHISYFQQISKNLLSAGKVPESEKLQSDLAASLPENTLLTYDLGYYYQDKGEGERALEVFKTLEKRITNPDKVFGICNTYSYLKFESEANRCLQKLSTKFNRNIMYLEALGESYERLGQKAEALKVYEKILQLNGDALFQIKTEYLLIAQNSLIQSDAPVTWLEKAPKRKPRVSEEKLDNIRLKILSLQQEMGLTQKSEPHLLKLISHHPENPEYHRQLGYLYSSQNRREEALKQFQEVYNLSPLDPEARFVLAEEDFRTQKFEDAWLKIKDVDTTKDSFRLNFKEEVLSAAGKADELRNFCLENGHESQELSIRCDYHLGNKKTGLKRLETYLKENEESISLRTLLISWYLDEEKVKEASVELDKLELQNKASPENKNQRKILSQIIEDLNFRNAWVVEATSRHVAMKGFQFNQANLDILKKMDGPGLGVNAQVFQGRRDFSLLSPYGYYGFKTGAAKVGPTFSTGNKKLKSPFFAEYTFYGSERLYLNLRHDHSTPEFQLVDLAKEKRAFRHQTGAFMSYHEKDDYNFDLSLNRNSYFFLQERGNDWQIFSEYLKQGLFHKNLSLGARVFALHLNSTGENIKRLHIKDAMAYFAVIQYGNSFLRKNHGQWNYLGKAAVGGDSQRSIGFGSTSNYFTQLEYIRKDGKGVQFFGEYYKESYLALVSNMTIFGINFFNYF